MGARRRAWLGRAPRRGRGPYEFAPNCQLIKWKGLREDDKLECQRSSENQPLVVESKPVSPKDSMTLSF